MSRPATDFTRCSLTTPCKRAINSSPPILETMSLLRNSRESCPAIFVSTASPNICPYWSLTILKLSISMTNSAAPSPSSRFTSRCSILCLADSLLYSLVRVSRSARAFNSWAASFSSFMSITIPTALQGCPWSSNWVVALSLHH